MSMFLKNFNKIIRQGNRARECLFLGTVLYGTVRYCTVTFFLRVASVEVPRRFRVRSVERRKLKTEWLLPFRYPVALYRVGVYFQQLH